MQAKPIRLTVYSVAHFAVDFACALLIFRSIGNSADRALVFLLYNYCAFALQMPVGLIADRLSRNAAMAAAGCALVSLAFALPSIPIAAAAVSGLGNALFHVGGGVDVLNDSGRKAWALGVYVSPGAAGIYFGSMLARGAAFPMWAALIVLIACAALILLAAHAGNTLAQSGNAQPRPMPGRAKALLVPAFCLFLVVVVRSFAGMTMQFDWKSQGLWGLFAMLAVVLGKCAGGFAMDRFGALRTSLISLMAAGALFLISSMPVAGIIAIFLFNMSMPITLSVLSQRMPAFKGFSFGLLTFALFLGFLPLGLGFVTSSPIWLISSLCMLSALLMVPGLAVGKGVDLAQ